MATTTFGVNDPLTNKLWAKKLQHEFFGETYLSRFMGTDDGALIRVLDEPSRQAGDTVTYGLRRRLTGDGRTDGEALEGNEEEMNFDDDSLTINELVHGVRLNRRMTSQRVAFNLRTEAKAALRDWYVNRLDVSAFNHLTGNTAVTAPKYTGFNDVVAPSNDYIIAAGGLADADAVGADDTAILTLGDLRAAKQRLILSNRARPVRYRGDEYWVAMIHPYQELQLKSDTSIGSWLDIQKAQLMGNGSDDNNLFTGSMGVVDNIVIHVSQNVTPGIGAGGAVNTTRRAVVCGAGALTIAFGQGYATGEKFNWVEEEFDYERFLGVSAQTILGMKKTQYNGTDYATCAIDTYGAAA